MHIHTQNSAPHRTALITGASSGIGLALAREAAADGCDLLLVARSMPPLEAASARLVRERGVRVRVFARDLSEPAAAERLWQELSEAGVQVEILINNAGVGLHGAVWEQDPDALERMLALNVTTLTGLTRLALPGMRSRRSGQILNLASLAGHQPAGPGMAAYYATKAYVLSFSRGLARELAGSGVTATALCPGPVRTAFGERSGASTSALYTRVPALTAEAAARAGYRGMKRGAAVVNPGLAAKLLAFAGQLPPRRIAIEVNRLLLKASASSHNQQPKETATGSGGSGGRSPPLDEERRT